MEAGIRYVRGNFWPGLKFVDLVDLNGQARDWLDTTANVRIHGTTGEVPFSRLALEPLQSMDGKPDYDTSLITFRVATKDCFVSYDGNYYSVPSEYAEKQLELKETEAGQLLILNTQGNEVTRHLVVHGHNRRIAVAAHYEDIRKSSRPARRPMAVQIALPEVWSSLPAAPQVEARSLFWYDQVLEVQE